MKPVTDGKKYISEMRPETGVHPSVDEKNMMSRRPHQKIGMEKPISARLLLGALLLGELAGLRIMKRHSVEVSRSYNALFKNSDGTFRRYRLWSR